MSLSWRLRCYESLPSTSDLCVGLARAGEPEGLAVLARRQSQGRGRRGRSWQSPPGNLCLSVLLRPAEPASRCGDWALLAGVALAEALGPLLPDPGALSLKWPNDVLLHGRKLGGILIDSAVGPDGRLDWLVIGFGANLAEAPALPERATAALAECCPAPPPEAVARSLLARLEYWRGRREGVREAWLAKAGEGSALDPLGAAAPRPL